jgi:hypothetical protein
MADRDHLEAVLQATTALNVAVRAAALDGLVVKAVVQQRSADSVLGERYPQVSSRVMRPVRHGR